MTTARRSSPRTPASKMLPRTKVGGALAAARRKGKSIVFTNGVFDLLHPGHLSLLQRARALGDLLVVGLNSDASVRRLKGPGRPFMGEKDRAFMLASLETVDYVVRFGEDTPERLIRQVEPDVLVKGGDWKTGAIVGRAFVEGRGGRVVRLRVVKGFSTTGIARSIRRRRT